MSVMTKTILFILLCAASFLFAQIDNESIAADDQFPKWLNSGDVRTEQTSGIAFLKSENGIKHFIIADDIGAVYKFELNDSSVSAITRINFSDSLSQLLSTFPKQDFEEIVFDKYDNSVYLSIEGNGSEFNKFVGIYHLKFTGLKNPFDKIISMDKINFTPAELFYKFTDYNIGYEGVTVDSNYFYLGLEGFTKNKLFADSAIIFIANKSNKEIVKTISTKQLGIHTICGLYSDRNYSVWGIDRNNRKIFHILFDEDFDVQSCSRYDFVSTIPAYKNFTYLASLESITMDDENNLYLIDDPWSQVFIPSDEILDQLDDETVKNFKDIIPVIFKFKIKNK